MGARIGKRRSGGEHAYFPSAQDRSKLPAMKRFMFLLGSGAIIAGCNALPCADITKTKAYARVQEDKKMIDERLVVAMKAGVAEARRRGGDVPADEDLPTSARLPSGELHPLVTEYARDGDGKLRGEGHSMSSMEEYLEQSLGYLKEEEDKFAIMRCFEG